MSGGLMDGPEILARTMTATRIADSLAISGNTTPEATVTPRWRAGQRSSTCLAPVRSCARMSPRAK